MFIKIFLVFSIAVGLGIKGLQRLKVREFAVNVILKVRGFAAITVLKVRGFAALITDIPQPSSESFNLNLTYVKSESRKKESHY